MSEHTDADLRSFIEGAGGPASLARAIGYPILALKDSMTDEAAAANRLTSKIRWLNLWLLLVTIAIFGLTFVLVVVGFRESEAIRQFSALTIAAPRQRVGAWVLWNNSTSTKGVSREGLWRPVRGFTTQAECQHFADTTQKTPPGAVPRIDKDAVYMPPYTCLPDTVDPRGPKAK